MNLMNLAVIGGLGAGAYFLFFTEQGKQMIGSFGIGSAEAAEDDDDGGGYEDPFKYMNKKNYKAWQMGSDEWEKIQKRVAKNNYIEAYLADAYL